MRRGEYLAARTVQGPGGNDCWLWTLKPDCDGYGVAYLNGRQWRAHRLSYTHHVGPIPDGHELDHRCETRLCVRPSHLEPVTGNHENFVRKHLREGHSRKVAEELATWDVRQIARRQARKVALREGRDPDKAEAVVALAAAVEGGVTAGARVRLGVSKRGAVWTVEELSADRFGRVWVDLRSITSKASRNVRFDEVTPA